MKKFFAVLFFMSLFVFPSFAYEAVPGDVIVVLRNTSGLELSSVKSNGGIQSLSTVQSLAHSVNASVTRTYDALSEQSGNIFMVIHSDTKNENDLLQEIRKNPNVIASSLNWISYLHADEKIPNDPEYYRLWGMEEINAPEIWNVSTGSEDVYVVVMDSGVDYNHPDLIDNFSHQYSRNFVNFSSASYEKNDYTDYHDHGTHVSGTIAGVGNNGIGVAGVNWKAKIISLRVADAQGRLEDADTISAINYLTGLLSSNPKLNFASVNMSFGGIRLFSPSEAIAQNDPYYLAIKALSDMNRIVICVAAGNSNLETGAPVMNTKYNIAGDLTSMKGSYTYPASFLGIDNMIVVGASTAEHAKASYSDYSSNFVHVAAPGGDGRNREVFSTIRTTVNGTARALPYGGMSGTSMATPHVSGTAALLKAIYPEATTGQIKAAILGGADSEYLTDNNVSMYGIIDIKGAVDFLSKTLAGNNPPKIAAEKLHNPIPNQPYNFELTASGTQPITWSVEGNLPAGLSLDADGKITGIVEEGEKTEFIITAENDYGYDSMVFTLSADNGVPPVIESFTLFNTGYTGVSYDLTAAIESGTWPIFWSVGSSDMPSSFGLSCDKNTGTVTFRPTETGMYHFAIKAENLAGEDSKYCTIIVTGASAPTILTSELRSGVVGMTYGLMSEDEVKAVILLDAPVGSVIHTDGARPISIDVSGLPDGLSFRNSTMRIGSYALQATLISGIPEASGDFNVTVTASNAFGTTSEDFTLSISDDYEPIFVIAPESYTMQKGFYFSKALLFLAKPAIEIIYEGLPEGLSVDLVEASESDYGIPKISISGIPTETGTYNLVLTVSTDTGSASREIAVTVTEPAAITTNFLPDAVKGASYNVSLSSFGDAALSWAVSDDAPLPSGLTLSESGDISGTPTESGNFQVIITAQLDENAKDTRSYALAVRETPSVTTKGLHNGTMNTPYSLVTLSADGTAPITWKISGGNFPEGLTLTSNGYILGTPTKSGTFPFTLRALNKAGYDEKTFTVNIASDGSETGGGGSTPGGGGESGGTTPSAAITTGSARGISSMTLGEITALAEEDGIIAAILPEISVNISNFYTYSSVDIFANVKLSDDVPVGYTLKWHPFKRSTTTGAMIEDAENESESAVFYGTDGGVITDVPSDKIVNVSAWLDAGKVYAPVISAVSKTSGDVGVSSSSGGCSSMSLGLALFGAVTALSAISRKKR